jgi:NitT/TauT family transport system substrate-binding protein
MTRWVALAVLAIVDGLGGAPPVLAQERVTFRMNWYWRGVQAPFALARERGYFSREGVDVELLEGRGSAFTVQLVGNRSDTFGFADGFTTMTAATKGVPVRAVATLLNGLSFAVVSLEDKGIRSAKDLEGRTLGVTPGDGHTQLWPAVVAANRLDISTIRLVHMDPRAKGPALTERHVDAVLGSAADLPITLGLRGFRTHVMTYRELGVPAVGFAVIAHEDTIVRRPDLVRRVVAGSVRGFEDARRDPQSAIAALLRLAPLVDTAAARQQLAVDLSFLFSAANVRQKVGWGPADDWQATLDLMRRYLDVQTDMPASAFYTNEFLP